MTAFTPNFAIPYQTLTGPFGLDPEGLLGEDGALAVDTALSGLDVRIDALEAAVKYTRIAEQVLVGTAASVTFSSIPAIYRNLQLVMVTRGDTAATFISQRLQFNSDATGIYDTQQLTANATTVAAFESVNQTGAEIGEAAAASATAGAASMAVIEIPNYTGTTFWKRLISKHSLCTAAGAAGNFSKQWAATWRSTAAINSIKVFPTAGNFIAGSSFQLYGLP